MTRLKPVIEQEGVSSGSFRMISTPRQVDREASGQLLQCTRSNATKDLNGHVRSSSGQDHTTIRYCCSQSMNSKMKNSKNKCWDQKRSCPLGYDHLQLPYLQDACRSAGFEDNRKVRTHRLHWEWHKFIASSQNWSDVDKGIWQLNHLDQQNLVGQILMANQIQFAIQSAYQTCWHLLGYLFGIFFWSIKLTKISVVVW